MKLGLKSISNNIYVNVFCLFASLQVQVQVQDFECVTSADEL